MKQRNIDKLVAAKMAMETESAKDAGTLGFMARAMVQATMPHRHTAESVHERKNGDFHLTMMASPSIGLPYGSIPRLMLAWIGAEVVRTKEREIVLGDSMSAFMRELDLLPTGGRWGSITRLKDQSKRLFGCTITTHIDGGGKFANGEPFNFGQAELWWNQQTPEQLGLFKSTLKLSETFYQEILEHPIPVDMRALKALKRSPMALDVYCWITYRIYTLNRSRRPDVMIPWESLQLQFGAGYPATPQGKRNFKKAFLRELNKVKATAYRDARVESDKAGLTLKESPLHLPGRPPKSPVFNDE